MNNIDPALVIYSIGGVLIVVGTFIVLSLFTEGVKTIHSKITKEENKKKDEQKKRNAA